VASRHKKRQIVLIEQIYLFFGLGRNVLALRGKGNLDFVFLQIFGPSGTNFYEMKAPEESNIFKDKAKKSERPQRSRTLEKPPFIGKIIDSE
jgi:hypothetical protein